MKNLRIRSAAKKAGLKGWEIADLIGVHPSTLSAKLRHEMPEAEQQRIISLIEHEGARRSGGDQSARG